MSNSPDGREWLEDLVTEALESAERELRELARERFSEEAAGRVAEERGRYFVELTRLAAALAGQARVEYVSETHVEQARNQLRSRPESVRTARLGEIGALLFGAAIGNTLALVSQDAISVLAYLLTSTCFAVGMALLGWRWGHTTG